MLIRGTKLPVRHINCISFSHPAQQQLTQAYAQKPGAIALRFPLMS